MQNWEFLLQKKGDEAWLPLESGDGLVSAEILEGYYRVAARSRLRGQPITIDFTHHSSEGVLLESSQVQRQVNDQGLVMVMTYRLLMSGTWQIRCSQDPSELAKLQLVVLTGEPPAPVPEALPSEPRQVLLRLDQLQFTVTDQSSLELTGEAELLGELEVTLNDPQHMRTVFKQRFALESGTYPYRFHLNLDLPSHSGVLIGTVQLILPPNLDYDFSDHVSYQAISVTCLPAAAEQMPDPLDPTADQRRDFTTPMLDILETRPHLERLYQEIDQLLTAPMPELVTPPPLSPPPQIISQLPAYQDLPLPSLAIAAEVVAGYPWKLTVTYAGEHKFAVRLWIKDAQTRQLIDGPRWLWDLEQVGDRYQTQTLVTIPLGILEATFEAVTVDIDSQRQSHKAKSSCAVLPPNLEQPDLSWLDQS